MRTVPIPDVSSQIPRLTGYLRNSAPYLQSNTSTSGTEAAPGRKIIPCNPLTGHRIKDGSVPAAMCVCVRSRLKALHQLPEDWTLSQCLFGEHMLALFPDEKVALVESEKSAVICAAVLLDYLCGRTRGKRQFCDKINVLRGRKVIACPNVEAYGTSDSPLSASTSQFCREECYRR